VGQVYCTPERLDILLREMYNIGTGGIYEQEKKDSRRKVGSSIRRAKKWLFPAFFRIIKTTPR